MLQLLHWARPAQQPCQEGCQYDTAFTLSIDCVPPYSLQLFYGAQVPPGQEGFLGWGTLWAILLRDFHTCHALLLPPTNLAWNLKGHLLSPAPARHLGNYTSPLMGGPLSSQAAVLLSLPSPVVALALGSFWRLNLGRRTGPFQRHLSRPMGPGFVHREGALTWPR